MMANKHPSSENFDLTDDKIYYSNEVNWQFLSNSQYQSFLECETSALAELEGEYNKDWDTDPILVGNYVHSYFESPEAHKQFKEDYKDLLHKRDGDLYKKFEVAEIMIERLKKDELFNLLWQGEKEVPLTGELYGVEWKGKIDLLNIEKGYFIDLKTTANIHRRNWSDDYGTYVSFVEKWGYVTQIALYEQLLEQQYGKPFTGYIYAVTREEIPDVAAIQVDEHKKSFELDLIEQRIERVEQVKTGQIEPKMCGKCDYCKVNKQLKDFIYSDELIN